MAATKMGGDSTATILQIKSEEELIRIGPQLLQAVEVGVGSQEKLPNPPIFHSNDLVVGPVVGQGGYCIVKAVTKLGKNGTIVDNVAAVDAQRVEGDCVVKCLKPTADETTGLNSKVVSLSQATVRGRVDLAIEAKILGMLQHPHIVSLRGLARVPSPLDSGFFIVMDRLYESLEDKIQKGWKQRFVMEALDAHIPGLPWNHRGLMDLQRERLRLLHDVATAFQYLHRKRYVCAPKQHGAVSLALTRARCNGQTGYSTETSSPRMWPLMPRVEPRSLILDWPRCCGRALWRRRRRPRVTGLKRCTISHPERGRFPTWHQRWPDNDPTTKSVTFSRLACSCGKPWLWSWRFWMQRVARRCILALSVATNDLPLVTSRIGHNKSLS